MLSLFITQLELGLVIYTVPRVTDATITVQSAAKIVTFSTGIKIEKKEKDYSVGKKEDVSAYVAVKPNIRDVRSKTIVAFSV